MTAAYAESDHEVVDYQIYALDPAVIDRQTGTPLQLRGPRPDLRPGAYLVAVGAAQTFGRFCAEPFPVGLGRELGLDALNLGRGGAGPSFFSEAGDELFAYVNGARCAVVQVMSGRSASNRLYESHGLGFHVRRSDGASLGADEAFRELLEGHDLDFVREVVAETRRNWIRDCRRLLERIRIPTVLLWFSTREPGYREGYGDVYQLFGAFPQLVNAEMVEEVRRDCHAYVELASTRGMPHPLRSRFTGRPVTIRDAWGGVWSEDWYYGSPEMHADAVAALREPCRRLLG